ncbi:MAG: SLOG family protein [Ruminococcus sp.]
MAQLLRDMQYNDMAFLNYRSQTACFTGHRPEKFLNPPFYSDQLTLRSIQTLLSMLIADTYEHGARFFITGMARGVDLWAGQFLLYMQQFLPDVHIIAAIPHAEHENSFHGAEANLLRQIGNAADAVLCISETPSKQCFLRRNDYMLSHAQTLLAVQHTKEGGTAYTIRKAQQNGNCRRILDLSHYERMIPLLERHPEVYRMYMPSQRYAFWQKYPRLLYQCGLLYED